MTETQESDFLQYIRHNMQAKSSQELLVIWRKNDRNEWSDEAFSVIHDVLLERLGSVPEQNGDSHRRRRSIRAKEKTNPLVPHVVIFAPLSLVFFLILLVPFIHPDEQDIWFTVLMSLSMALSCFLPGFFLGWQSWFQSEKVKSKAKERLPTLKGSISYRLYAYVFADRSVATYFLFQMRLTSICLIIAGVWMILFMTMALPQ